jgi:hypothetical protein
METTIQISKELLDRLRSMKVYSKESYENIIWDLVEDRLEFSSTTKKNIEKSQKDIKDKKTTSLESLKVKIGV